MNRELWNIRHVCLRGKNCSWFWINAWQVKLIFTMDCLTVLWCFSVYCEIATKLLLTGKYTWWIAREAYWSCSYFSFRAQICHRPKTGTRSIMTDRVVSVLPYKIICLQYAGVPFFFHCDLGSLFYNWVLLWNLKRKFFFPFPPFLVFFFFFVVHLSVKLIGSVFCQCIHIRIYFIWLWSIAI